MPSVELRQITRNTAVDALLSRIDTGISVGDMYAQLDQGGELYGLFVGDHLVSVMIVHVLAGSHEMWVTHAAGFMPGIDLTHVLAHGLDALAHKKGCGSVAFMTKRQGLIRKIQRHGYKAHETVMRKAVPCQAQ